ncbi:hypothetical protein EUAN_22530 [Andreesenia angusta]|uniref:Uncharacterized protein n=1 Tax=Andreesenia angusta TaxID=39480 RepID=A0A1S1V422_9FIRM|nr:hypothetical protein EUAN_22530 [Andreesenia angusta]
MEKKHKKRATTAGTVITQTVKNILKPIISQGYIQVKE